MKSKKLFMWGLVGVFVLALASFTVTYTVRFTEAAVVTTFGKASEGADAKRDGLHWKWPYPFQSVTKYDTRMRFVQTKLETQQTADDKQIIVEAFCMWRVKDPMKFFRRFSIAGERASDHYKEAEDRLTGFLRSAMARTSSYRMSELFPSDGSPTKLGDLERDMLLAMTQSAERGSDSRLDDYGVEVIDVGVSRIQFPAATTEAVVQRMIASRNKLVTEIESQGEGEAERIKSAAQAQADTIMAFAMQRAAEIRAQGDVEAAPWLAQMDQEPELAIFVKNLDIMRESLARKLTLIFSDATPGLEFLNPSFMRGVSGGALPRINIGTEVPGGAGGGTQGGER